MTIELTRCDELEFKDYDFDFKFAGVECFFIGTVTIEFESDVSWWPKSFSGWMFIGNSGEPEDETQGTWVAGGEIFNAMAKEIENSDYIGEQIYDQVHGY